MIELRCSRDLAVRLGAILAETTAHHRQLSDAGHLLVRDIETGWPMFWPWQLSRGDMSETRTFAHGAKARWNGTGWEIIQ